MRVQKNPKAFAYRVPIGDYNYLQWSMAYYLKLRENKSCCDLSNWQYDNYFHSKWHPNHLEINKCNSGHLHSLELHLFSSQPEISHMLNGTTPETQHRTWGRLWFQLLILRKSFLHIWKTDSCVFKSKCVRTLTRDWSIWMWQVKCVLESNFRHQHKVRVVTVEILWWRCHLRFPRLS